LIFAPYSPHFLAIFCALATSVIETFQFMVKKVGGTSKIYLKFKISKRLMELVVY